MRNTKLHEPTLDLRDKAEDKSAELSVVNDDHEQPDQVETSSVPYELGQLGPELHALVNKGRLSTGVLSTVTGALGLPGQLLDVPGFYATAALNIQRIATFFGYDATSPQERDFALQILLIGHLPTERGRAEELAKIHFSNSPRLYARELGALVAARGSTISIFKMASKMLSARFRYLVPVVGSVANLASNLRVMESIQDTAIRGYSRRANLKESLNPPESDS